MGDANASIPTPQPVFARPMFGASPRVAAATSLTFVAQAALDDGLADRLALSRRLVAVGRHPSPRQGRPARERRDARDHGRPRHVRGAHRRRAHHRAARRRCSRWPSATSCSERRAPMSTATLLLLGDSRFPTGAHAHSARCRGEPRPWRPAHDRAARRRSSTDGSARSPPPRRPSPRPPAPACCRGTTSTSSSPRARRRRDCGCSAARSAASCCAPAERAWPGAGVRTRCAPIHPDGPLQPIVLGAVAGTRRPHPSRGGAVLAAPPRRRRHHRRGAPDRTRSVRRPRRGRPSRAAARRPRRCRGDGRRRSGRRRTAPIRRPACSPTSSPSTTPPGR